MFTNAPADSSCFFTLEVISSKLIQPWFKGLNIVQGFTIFNFFQDNRQQKSCNIRIKY